MTLFFMFGTYTHEGIEGINASRTKKAEEVVPPKTEEDLNDTIMALKKSQK